MWKNICFLILFSTVIDIAILGFSPHFITFSFITLKELPYLKGHSSNFSIVLS